ncbi:hypothetical protein STENM327S_07379 [Streptomyces tendae]
MVTYDGGRARRGAAGGGASVRPGYPVLGPVRRRFGGERGQARGQVARRPARVGGGEGGGRGVGGRVRGERGGRRRGLVGVADRTVPQFRHAAYQLGASPYGGGGRAVPGRGEQGAGPFGAPGKQGLFGRGGVPLGPSSPSAVAAARRG